MVRRSQTRSAALLRLTALAISAFICVHPVAAVATSCDERAISQTSPEEAARMIWDRSDVIGFGYASAVNDEQREQHFVDMVVSLKGDANQRYAFVPYRLGRVGWHTPEIRRLRARPDEVVFVTLVRTDSGYMIPACRMNLIHSNREAIIRGLAALAARQRSGSLAGR